MYCYDIITDHWTILPQPGHGLGILHTIDGMLTIFGGNDPVTNEIFNKVTTYNNDTNKWYSCYPNLLNNRSQPGVITYHNCVMVMGGMISPGTTDVTIEVMNYRDELQWREISIKLPHPMFGIKPIISGENVVIVGYSTTKGRYNRYYQFKVEEMISSLDKPLSTGAVSTQWKELSPATHYNTATVPYSNPPVIIGGSNAKGDIPTSDIMLYDTSKNSWIEVDSLTSPRKHVGIGLLNNYTIIVIGGTSGGTGVEGAMASSLTTVEIGNIVVNN